MFGRQDYITRVRRNNFDETSDESSLTSATAESREIAVSTIDGHEESSEESVDGKHLVINTVARKL